MANFNLEKRRKNLGVSTNVGDPMAHGMTGGKMAYRTVEGSRSAKKAAKAARRQGRGR